MGGLANPVKNFRYLLELDGADAFLIQKITPPSMESQAVEHGAPGNIPNVETPGKVVVGDLVVEKLVPADRADQWVHDWFAQAIGGLADEFRRVGFLRMLSANAVTTSKKFFLGNVWPKKIEYNEMDTSGNDNVIEKITFSVQFFHDEESALLNGLFGSNAVNAAGIGSNFGQE